MTPFFWICAGAIFVAGTLPVAVFATTRKLTRSNAGLRACVKQYASECAECDGTGKLRGEIGFEEVCPECEEIRALLDGKP